MNPAFHEDGYIHFDWEGYCIHHEASMSSVNDMESVPQQLLQPHFAVIAQHVNADPDFKASASNISFTFAVIESRCPEGSIIFGIEDGKCSLSVGPAHAGTFGLQARPEDWQAFFADPLVRPYQSFWGILRVLGPQHHDIRIVGDETAFGRHARLWRIILDRVRDAVHGRPIKTDLDDVPEDEATDDDAVVGRYIWIASGMFGKVKIFYESSGSGPQDLLFLHTAGSDSRQYHSLMNNRLLQERLRMFAFDLPAHGRSSLGSRQSIGDYALDEASYLEVIGAVIRKLGLRRSILCGASMAGHVCLAAAIHARELDVHGVIPCEGCEHLPFTQPIYEIGGADSSILDPERVCGMCAPTAPEYYKRQIWWQYSSQGYGVFAGDLKFYFRGWDGRGRVEGIDTSLCPVYMLTGDFDYSCTTEASKDTASKIPGANFETMPAGHFPLTENPKAVLPYLLRAIEYILASRARE